MLLLICSGSRSVACAGGEEEGGDATGMLWLPRPGSTPSPSAPLLPSESSTPRGTSALGSGAGVATGVVWIGLSGTKSSLYSGWSWGGEAGGAGGGDSVREMAGSAFEVRV